MSSPNLMTVACGGVKTQLVVDVGLHDEAWLFNGVSIAYLHTYMRSYIHAVQTARIIARMLGNR